MTTYDLSFEAQWARSATITFQLVNGAWVDDAEYLDLLDPADGDNPRTLTKPSGANIVLPNSDAVHREGYIFSGWAKEGSADTVAFNLESLNIVMFDADVTLYAVWDKILYTVIYNVGPSDVHIPTNTAVIWEDKPLDNYATVQGRPGYTFVGWYGVAQERDANGNPIVISADSRLASTASFGDIVKELGLTDATVPTEGITLYAHYKGEITTLTYAAKPGEGKGWVSNSSDTLNVGDGVPKCSYATPDPGYEFLGWYDRQGNEKGRGTFGWYDDEHNLISTDENPTGIDTSNLHIGYYFVPTKKNTETWAPTVFYAYFKPIQYIVKFDKNSEEAFGSLADLYVDYDKEQALPDGSTAIVRDGWQLKGWLTPSRQETYYTDQDGIEVTLMTRTAYYDAEGHEITEYEGDAPESYATSAELTYMLYDGGSPVLVDGTEHRYTERERTLYLDWDGKWVTTEVELDAKSGKVYNMASTAKAVITLKAVWKEVGHALYYDANNDGKATVKDEVQGSLHKNGEVVNTAVAGDITGDMTRVGYEFKGWTTFENRNEHHLTLSETGDSKILVQAAELIGYKAKDGEGTITVEAYEALSDEDKAGYKAIYSDPVYDTKVYFSRGGKYIMPNVNTTLYAYWEPIVYTVTFHGNAWDAYNANNTTDAVSVEVYYDEYVSLASRFKREGNIFNGWKTGPTSGTEYKVTQPKEKNLRETAGVIDLYAQWIKSFVTVTFVSADYTKGTIVPLPKAQETQRIEYEGTAKFDPNVYTQGSDVAPGSAEAAQAERVGKHALTTFWVYRNYTHERTAGEIYQDAKDNWYEEIMYTDVSSIVIYGPTSFVAQWEDPFTVWYTNGTIEDAQGGQVAVDSFQERYQKPGANPATGTVIYEVDPAGKLPSFTDENGNALPKSFKVDDTWYLFSGWRLQGTDKVFRLYDLSDISALTEFTPAQRKHVNESATADETAAGTDKGLVFVAEWSKAHFQVVFNEKLTSPTAANAAYVPTNPRTETSVSISGSTMDQSFVYEIGQHLWANPYKASGYTFVGWNTKADGTGDTYGDGDELTVHENSDLAALIVGTTSDTEVAKLHLYAMWQPAYYTVTVNAGQEGFGAITSSTLTPVYKRGNEDYIALPEGKTESEMLSQGYTKYYRFDVAYGSPVSSVEGVVLGWDSYDYRLTGWTYTMIDVNGDPVAGTTRYYANTGTLGLEEIGWKDDDNVTHYMVLGPVTATAQWTKRAIVKYQPGDYGNFDEQEIRDFIAGELMPRFRTSQGAQGASTITAEGMPLGKDENNDGEADWLFDYWAAPNGAKYYQGVRNGVSFLYTDPADPDGSVFASIPEDGLTLRAEWYPARMTLTLDPN